MSRFMSVSWTVISILALIYLILSPFGVYMASVGGHHSVVATLVFIGFVSAVWSLVHIYGAGYARGSEVWAGSIPTVQMPWAIPKRIDRELVIKKCSLYDNENVFVVERVLPIYGSYLLLLSSARYSSKKYRGTQRIVFSRDLVQEGSFYRLAYKEIAGRGALFMETQHADHRLIQK